MAKAKTVKQLKAEGFTDAGLFGLEYRRTINVINRLLKPYGLTLVVYNNRQEYADESFVKIEHTKEHEEKIKQSYSKHAAWCQVNYDCNCGADDE